MTNPTSLAALQRPVRDYLFRHWSGSASIAWAFWVNLVAVRVVLIPLDAVLVEWQVLATIPRVLVYELGLHAPIFIWQVVGVVRACDDYLRAHGSVVTVWLIYVAMLLSVIPICLTIWSTVLLVRGVPDPGLIFEQWAEERRGRYQLVAHPAQKRINFDGSFELGTTAAFADVLANNPATKTIVLNSVGGNVFEARGVAKLIEDHALNTHVEVECSSACTTAFLAGAHRSIGSDGRLGFHQYGFGNNTDVLRFDVAHEQARDRAYFRRRGVSQTFLEQIFLMDPSELWRPAHAELLKAGMIDEFRSLGAQ